MSSKNAGSQNFKSKLVESDVDEILRSTLTQKEIADHYGVSQSLISRIRRRKLWTHVHISTENLPPINR